jgi:hypothetical protein
LERILSATNLNLAYKQVKRNGGAGGVDGYDRNREMHRIGMRETRMTVMREMRMTGMKETLRIRMVKRVPLECSGEY